jgi:hypothetical protein
MIPAPPQILSSTQGFARCRGESAYPKFWNGLLGQWIAPLGVTGDTLFDWSGGGSVGTLRNMDPETAWVASRYGWVLDFDGVDDYVDCGNAAILNEPGYQFTGEAWVYYRGGETAPRMYDKYPAPTMYVQLNTRSLSWLGLIDGTYVSLNASQSQLTLDAWNHCVHTYQSGEGVKSYLNGTHRDTDNSHSGPLSTTSTTLKLGNRGALDRALDGQLSIVRWWSRALSAAEIAQLYWDPFAPLRLRRQIRGIVPAVGGPYRAVAGELFHAGAAEGELFSTGSVIGACAGRSGW